MKNIYTEHEIKSKRFNQTYSVVICEGKRNYVAVMNKNNPLSMLGREFATLADARNHYKDSGLKTGLLELELKLNRS